jgi:hypothetical protein
VGEIELPVPRIAFHHPEDAAADQVPAQHEKDNYRLVSRPAQEVRNEKQGVMCGQLVVIHENQIAPVLQAYQQSGESTDQIEKDRSLGLGEGYAGGVSIHYYSTGEPVVL